MAKPPSAVLLFKSPLPLDLSEPAISDFEADKWFNGFSEDALESPFLQKLFLRESGPAAAALRLGIQYSNRGVVCGCGTLQPFSRLPQHRPSRLHFRDQIACAAWCGGRAGGRAGEADGQAGVLPRISWK